MNKKFVQNFLFLLTFTKKCLKLFLFSLLFFTKFTFQGSFVLKEVQASTLEKGEKIFKHNCIVCHAGGNNIIIPEKNLRKETLEANGMNTKSAIFYQVINGKNGMPAFGGRLNENEIEAVAIYVLEESSQNFVPSK